jgi:hypothetical protein
MALPWLHVQSRNLQDLPVKADLEPAAALIVPNVDAEVVSLGNRHSRAHTGKLLLQRINTHKQTF